MSMDYWAISGYGIKIRQDMIDTTKLQPLTDLNDEEFKAELEKNNAMDILQDGFLNEVFDTLSPLLECGDTNDMDLGLYLMYYYRPPWHLRESEKSLTPKDIQDEIAKVLLPYLKDEYDEKWLEKEINHISTCGAG